MAMMSRRVLHDPHNGRLDLKKGVIKSVGIPTQRIKRMDYGFCGLTDLWTEGIMVYSL